MNMLSPRVATNWKFSILVGFIAFVIYFFTMAPDLVWQDQGDFQVWVAQCKLQQPGDVVRVHPLYIIFAHFLGKVTSLSYAYAANLTSAVFAALGISGIAALVYSQTKRILPSVLAAGICGLGHTYWFMATQAQTYSMSNAYTIWALLFTTFYLTTHSKKHLYTACFIFGLGVSVHNMSQIAFVVLAILLAYQLYKKSINFKTAIICAVFWLIGGMFWLYAIALEYQATGDLLGSILSGIYGRWGSAVFNAADIIHLSKRSIQFFILNFPTPLVFCAIPGIIFGKRVIDSRVYNLLLACLVLYILFAFRYHVPNQNHFFMPAYILVSIFVGIGYVHLRSHELSADWLVVLVLLAWIVPTYAGLSFEAQACGFKWGHNRQIPYRQEYNYYIEPWQQGQTGPRRMVNEIFAILPQDAVLVVDSTPYSAFEYAIDIEGQRTDIKLLDLSEYDNQHIDNKDVYSLMNSNLYKNCIGDNVEFTPVNLPEEQKIYKLRQTE